MGVEGIGSSVIIALAALLWLVYLVPTWLRRREYLATERNAVRLQQTLRIMAETAEVPDQVRAETSARSAALQERVLRKEQQRAVAVAEAQAAALAREAARRLAETQPAIAADVAVGSSASRRLRRSRVITSIFLLVALVASGIGVAQFMAVGSWALVAAGLIVTVGAFTMLGQMAAVSTARAELARSLRTRPAVVVKKQSISVPVPQAPVQTTWTPVAVPKPLYMTRPQVERAVIASLEAAAELRQATADAEEALRRAHQEPEVTPIRPVAAASSGVATAAPSRFATAAPSRFAAMGFIDEPQAGKTDLDAVLRRRRIAAAS
ncbi:hypothetical protein [Glaciihabitans sp. UYNi722]|uniref:hypothetical protein n=1 Tax=Glaciihabitans sp. UYNi722 TaxID=3156344 RepID=UPI00339934A5